MDTWNLLTNEFNLAFNTMTESIGNTPFALLLVILAPLLFTAYVFFNWLVKEGGEHDELEKFNGLLEISQSHFLSPFSTILLVDDDTNFLEMSSKLLESKGHHVKTAMTGQQALDILRADFEHNIQVVVTDFKLPDFNGVELSQKNGHIYPFLLVSALDGNQISFHSFDVVDGYLHKSKFRKDFEKEFEKTIDNWIKNENKAA
ncbi:MAG: response regulator [Bacteriovoracaceae bacterium]